MEKPLPLTDLEANYKHAVDQSRYIREHLAQKILLLLIVTFILSFFLLAQFAPRKSDNIERNFFDKISLIESNELLEIFSTNLTDFQKDLKLRIWTNDLTKKQTVLFWNWMNNRQKQALI